MIRGLFVALTLAGGPTSIPSLLLAGSVLAAPVRGSTQEVSRPPAPAPGEMRRKLGALLLHPLRLPEGRARMVTATALEGTEREPAPPRPATAREAALGQGPPAGADRADRTGEDRLAASAVVEAGNAGSARLFGVSTPGGIALTWTSTRERAGEGESGTPTSVRLYRWRRTERPAPLLEEPLAASAFLDATAQPGWTYWYAVERLGAAGLGRFALVRVRHADPAELQVIGGDGTAVWIRVTRTAADATETVTVSVKQGQPVADAAGTLVTSWRVRTIREIVLRREVQRIEPVFRPDGRVALEVGGDRLLRAPRSRWRDEPALEVVVENADGERRTLVGPRGAPERGKG